MIEESGGGNMKGDEELEMLLDEIPHATSHNLHRLHHRHHHPHHHTSQHHHQHDVNSHVYDAPVTASFAATRTTRGGNDDEQSRHYKYACASPVSGFSLQSDGSSSSLFSAGHSFSDNGSPTPPPLEDSLKSHMPYAASHCPDGLWMDSKLPDSLVGKKANESVIDELSLCRNLNKMYITREQEDYTLRDFSLNSNGVHFNDQINFDAYRTPANLKKAYADHVRIQSLPEEKMKSFHGEMSTALSGLQEDYKVNSPLGSRFSSALFPNKELNCCNGQIGSIWHRTNEQTSNYHHHRGSPVSNLSSSLGRISVADALLYSQRNGMNWNEETGGLLNVPISPRLTQQGPHLNVESLRQYGVPLFNGRAKAPPNIKFSRADFDAFNGEGSFIIQGEGFNYVTNKGVEFPRVSNRAALNEIGMSRRPERRSQLNNQSQMAGIYANARSAKSLPFRCNYLAETRGNIYFIAKDQHGCRFLQKVFDEGTKQDVQLIFNEIIDHVVELMMNPFGNYLMQKLLDVCTEEQKMHILLMVTEEPGQLVQISLNTHGTRVVQKLIETLKTRQQISLVISALEPGFLALIKDLNGNHVVQRCLQCLSNEDNKFIFVSAAKYCVDIATHQHGCCVLQRCISHSNGQYREHLVAEISNSGLLLAEDPYGNYVVQFILELKIPSATSNLISQFEGNYVHLSTQKFSSHVVERCLQVFNNDGRSQIIHELLSVSHFEQLLQDPHANYVIQAGLRYSEGSLYNLLVETIEVHRAVARNSPYSKRIFSQKLLKK